MIYLFVLVLFAFFYMLSSGKWFGNAEDRRKKKLKLIEYAGATAIFLMMLEAVLSGRAEYIWYPVAVMIIIALVYTGKIWRYLTGQQSEQS